jgi:uncharacterized membrane protein YvbJ
MKFCPKCGAPREGRFCIKCGFNFESEGQTGSAPVVVVQSQRPQKYGEGFTEEGNCSNCGAQRAVGQATCSLCSADF